MHPIWIAIELGFVITLLVGGYFMRTYISDNQNQRILHVRRKNELARKLSALQSNIPAYENKLKELNEQLRQRVDEPAETVH